MTLRRLLGRELAPELPYSYRGMAVSSRPYATCPMHRVPYIPRALHATCPTCDTPLSPVPTQVQVERASATNPGLPPSSLMSFLRVNASIQGMMLTDFDSQYINPYFQSEYDDGFNVTIQVGHVSLVARHPSAGCQKRALHRLAFVEACLDAAAGLARLMKGCVHSRGTVRCLNGSR